MEPLDIVTEKDYKSAWDEAIDPASMDPDYKSAWDEAIDPASIDF